LLVTNQSHRHANRYFTLGGFVLVIPELLYTVGKERRRPE
jgi:hypothetical protein